MITEPPASDDKAARRAVTVFPVLVLVAGAAGLVTPGTFAGWTSTVPYLLGTVMFCMGLTMTPARRDWPRTGHRPRAPYAGCS